MDLMTATHQLLFMTDDQLIDLLRAVEDEQDRRANDDNDGGTFSSSLPNEYHQFRDAPAMSEDEDAGAHDA